MRNRPLSVSIRLALACALTAGAAHAQPLAEEPAAATASRLAQAPDALPLVVIDRAQIDASGHVLLADILRDLPQASFGNFRPQSGSSAQALANIDLRGLGAGRTLVLVDGRRIAASPVSASFGADLNAIPLALVERIEVYAGGASAIHGQDAVGGVVNLVTRRHFDGVQLRVGHAASEVRGGDLDDMSMVFGVGSERTRLIGGASKARRGMLFTRDQIGGEARGVGLFGNNYYNWSTGALEVVPGFSCDQGAFYLLPTGVCSFDFNDVAANEAKVANTSVFLRGEHQINDRWQVHASASVARVESFGRYAPTPGQVVVDDGTPNDINGGVACGAAGCAPGTTDGLPTYYYHRFAAAGNRDNFTDTTRADYLVGFQGQLTDTLDMDFGLRRSDYKYVELGRGYIVSDLANQLANDGRYDLSDPFGASPEVLSSLQATISREASMREDTVYATVNASLFGMAGGTSHAVFGAERVTTRYRDQYDSLSEAGRVLGTAGNSAGGDRDYTAVFAEWRLPFTPRLDLTLAARYDDFDRLDGQFSPQAKLRWQPLDVLTLRAQWEQGFRTPGLDITTQLPSPSNEFINDPRTCSVLGQPPFCQVQVPVVAIGNPLLASEQSEHLGAGVVYQPLDALRLSLDYTRTRVEDTIVRYRAQDLVNSELDPSIFGPLPDGLGVFRAADGSVREVVVGFGNGGAVEVDALDLVVAADFSLGRYGELGSELAVSRLLRYEILSAGGVGSSFEGRFGYPETRARLATTWSLGDLSIGWRAHGIQGQSSGSANNRIGSYVTHDLSLAWQTPWRATLSAGVNNVGDRYPALRAFDGRPFNFNLYTSYGRTPYLRYTQTF
ncbi:TonB-dependent receptor domain-containing protein [Arenimonas aestuarii]